MTRARVILYLSCLGSGGWPAVRARGAGAGGTGRGSCRKRSTHVLCQSHILCASGLQRDRMLSEMLQHVEDSGEPEMLNSTLRLVVQRHAQVLDSTVHSITSRKLCIRRIVS